ncbi:MAG TPA: hypothetical protein VHD60_01800 [Candidatus Saccharimonadales bacterium]|nr:hypothetical protein [Candidatus Saccharimonadales bacterium]
MTTMHTPDQDSGLYPQEGHVDAIPTLENAPVASDELAEDPTTPQVNMQTEETTAPEPQPLSATAAIEAPERPAEPQTDRSDKKPRFTPFQKGVATGLVALGAVGGVYELGKSAGGKPAATQPSTTAGATNSANPTQTNQTSTESPTPTNTLPGATSSVSVAKGGGTGETQGTSETGPAPGNIDLSNTLFSPTVNTDETIDSTWGGQQIELSKLLGPATYSPTEVAGSVLNQMACLLSCDLGNNGSSQLPDYFSDQQPMQEGMKNFAEFFQSNSKGGPHSDQLEFYDTADSPAVFEWGPTDDSGNPTLVMKSGTLYAQRITGGSWQTHEGRDINKATPITNLTIIYKPSANGYTISVQGFEMSPVLAAILSK